MRSSGSRARVDTAFPSGVLGNDANVMFNTIAIDDGAVPASRGSGVVMMQARAGSRIWANDLQTRHGISVSYSQPMPGGGIDVRNNKVLAQRQGIYSQNGEFPPSVLVEDNTIVIGETGDMGSQSGIMVYAGQDAKVRRNSVQWTAPTLNGSGIYSWATQATQVFTISDNSVAGGSNGIQLWGASGATTSVFNNRITAAVGISAVSNYEADGTTGVVTIENNNVLATYAGISVGVGAGALATTRVTNNIIMGNSATIGLERNRELDGPAFRAFNNTISGFTNAFTDFDTCSGCSVSTLNASRYGYGNLTTPAITDAALVTQDTTACAILVGGVDTSQRVRPDMRLSTLPLDLKNAWRTLNGPSVTCPSNGVSIGAVEVD